MTSRAAKRRRPIRNFRKLPEKLTQRSLLDENATVYELKPIKKARVTTEPVRQQNPVTSSYFSNGGSDVMDEKKQKTKKTTGHTIFSVKPHHDSNFNPHHRYRYLGYSVWVGQINTGGITKALGFVAKLWPAHVVSTD